MEKHIPRQCDVLVIGGGPSGSCAANLLAQKGYHTVLLDKIHHPRNTVGESLIPHFWDYTDMMQVSDQILEEGFVKKGGGIALWKGKTRRLRFSRFGRNRPTYHVERDKFDHLLLHSARNQGAAIFEGYAVTEVALADDGIIASWRHGESGSHGKICSRFAIDASGQSSVVSSQMGLRKFDDAFKFMAMWGYFRGGDFLTFEGSRHAVSAWKQHPPVTFVSGFEDWGWVWQIVLRERVSVGVILPRERLKAFSGGRKALTAHFLDLVKRTPVTAKLMADAEFEPGSLEVIRNYAYKPTRLTVGHCFMTGDAAAFVDPINSAGVPFGLYSAYLASWAIDEALKKPKRLNYVKKLFEQQYRQRLDLFRLLAFPADERDDSQFKQARRALALNSSDEQKLMLLQATLNSRCQGVSKIMGQLDIHHQDYLEGSDLDLAI